MSTRSTSALYATVRARLLGFTPLSGDTLQTILGGRVYHAEAPQSAVMPYAVITFLDRAVDGAFDSVRDVIMCEVQFYDAPRQQMGAIEDAADLADAALLRWHDASSGLLFARERTRSTLPPDPDPHHRATARVRCVYPLITWPRSLTVYVS